MSVVLAPRKLREAEEENKIDNVDERPSILLLVPNVEAKMVRTDDLEPVNVLTAEAEKDND